MSLSAIIFLVGFTAGCVLAFVRNPVYGLLTYIATLYFDPAGQWWGRAALHDVRWELIPAAITLVAMVLYGRRLFPSSLFRSGAFWGFLVFVLWGIVQLQWALDTDAQEQLVTIWSKFLVVSIMICACVDSWKNLRLVLWAHVLGCVYMGWMAYAYNRGGRFEGFGLGSVEDANTGALMLVTGFIAAASLFLSGSWRTKAALLPAMGLIANGIIATESREGFLALLGSGIVFIIFTPRVFRKRVIAAALVAGIGFLVLTNASFWSRVRTIEDAGAAVQGVDTGHSRVEIAKAQWKIFQEHPLGCGHACTDVLSPQFVPPEYLALSGRRSSHNTFMTMLVDHGIPGAVLYIALLLWTYKKLKAFGPQARSMSGFPGTFFPAVAGVLVAITIADMFSQLPLLEVRVWFVSLLIAYAQLLQVHVAPAREEDDAPQVAQAT
jgi:O-antigen ligase